MCHKEVPVSIELMPLLGGRTVLITVAEVDDKTLRVNVIPTRAKADQNPALTTPLTYTGWPGAEGSVIGELQVRLYTRRPRLTHPKVEFAPKRLKQELTENPGEQCPPGKTKTRVKALLAERHPTNRAGEAVGRRRHVRKVAVFVN
jgi:hypothetical protein